MKKFLFLILTFCLACSMPALAQETGSPANRVVIGNEYFYVHTVQPGETLYSLGRKYDLSPEEIVRYNPHTAEGLRAGEVIKVPAPEPEPLPRNIRNRTTSNRRVEVHTVQAGENAYRIAQRYAVTVDNLIESNPGLDPAHLSIGQVIRIPQGMVGTSTQSEIEAGFNQYAEALTEVTPGLAYHLVEPGETLYSLSNQLGVSQEVLESYNRTELAGGLKSGSILKYPSEADGEAFDDEEDPDPEQPIIYEDRDAKPINTTRPLQVALLMPFTQNGAPSNSMVSYYNGTLLALEELKQAGISVQLSVYDTQRSENQIRRILDNPALEDADLIIGPHFMNQNEEDQFETVARFAYRNRIPVVSPQQSVESGNPFVYQARPNDNNQYDKIKELLTPDKNIILISPSAGVNAGFMGAIERFLPQSAKRLSYSRATTANSIESLMTREGENIILVPTSDRTTTDEVLAKISTIQNTYSSRTGRSYQIQVVGCPEWYDFTTIDRDLFFKLGVTYVTSYYYDRANPAILLFDQRYMQTFGSPYPPRFAYRGYDVAKVFITAMKQYGDRFSSSINRVDAGTLVPYRFVRDNGQWINDQWVLVHYKADYSLVIR